jgi:hypothetical protein
MHTCDALSTCGNASTAASHHAPRRGRVAPYALKAAQRCAIQQRMRPRRARGQCLVVALGLPPLAAEVPQLSRRARHGVDEKLLSWPRCTHGAAIADFTRVCAHAVMNCGECSLADIATSAREQPPAATRRQRAVTHVACLRRPRSLLCARLHRLCAPRGQPRQARVLFCDRPR